MKNNIIFGDSFDILASMPDGYVSSCVTDPPYGMNFQSNRSKNGPRHRKIESDDKINTEWISIVFNKLREGGALITFCDWKTSDVWRNAIEKNGFNLKSQIIWDRQIHGMGDLTGSFAPMHDIIWYATKGRRKFVNGRPKSVISVPRPLPSQDHGHPTCKPVSLMAHILRSIDDGLGGFILDPFMGSGSTGVACVETNFDFIGIEKDPEYFNIACERIKNVYPDVKIYPKTIKEETAQ